MNPYVLFGGELSLFTRKLEAALIFYGAPFEFQNKNSLADPELLETRAGTHQVPVLQTPENWVIADTTPILAMLDGRFPGREMFPTGAQGVLVHLLEEYLDEWVARVMVHYRWHYPDSTEFAAMQISGGRREVADRIKTWGPRACRATGTDSETQRAAAEAEYQRLLEAAELQLQTTAFLMGDRPTAVDCIFLGGLRAHTNMDPDPKKLVAQFPNVLQWCESAADSWAGSGELAPVTKPTHFAKHILSEIVDTYGVFVLANKAALDVGAKAFHCEVYAESVSYLTRPYPEQARMMLVNRYLALSDTEAQTLGQLSREYGLHMILGE